MSYDCVFCSIVEGKREAALVYTDEHFTVFMDKYPISNGHTLVIPKKHYPTILEMSSSEVTMLFALVHRVAYAVVRALNAQGFSIAQNNGIVAHQVVPHVHVHIVPRYAGEERGKYASRRIATLEELVTVASTIRSALYDDVKGDVRIVI